jgi:hypothetical protein
MANTFYIDNFVIGRPEAFRVALTSSTTFITMEALNGHKLRIRKGGVTYGIPLVETTDPKASVVRFYDGASTKALRKI